jgi:chromate reductase
MKKLVAFAGSNSTTSINKKLVTYTANLFNDYEIEILDLNDFEMPIYSADREKKDGIHPLAIAFYNKITEADLLVVSLAEHNGNYAAAFKNILDWTSRYNNKLFQQKEMLLMATSPGARGGKSVLDIAENRFPRNGAKIIGTFSLPNFHDNFCNERGLTNESLKSELFQTIEKIK